MRHVLIVCLTVFLGLFGASIVNAAAPIVSIRTEPQNGIALEVSASEATDTATLETTASWVQKNLDTAISGNPELKPEIVIAAPDANGQPAVQAVEAKSIRGHFKALFDKHYRVTFTLIRGVSNASVVTWGLILSSHISIWDSLPVGLVAGSMSAGFQFFNQPYQRWLLKSKTFAGQMGRTYFVNVIYMAIAKLTSIATGITTDVSLAGASSTILKTAFLGTLAQGTWNLAVAQAARIAIERTPENASKIRSMNDFKTLVISMVSTALSVASLVGAPVTDAAMIVMSATGSVYYAWTALKARRWAEEKVVMKTRAKVCEQQFVVP